MKLNVLYIVTYVTVHLFTCLLLRDNYPGVFTTGMNFVSKDTECSSSDSLLKRVYTANCIV